MATRGPQTPALAWALIGAWISLAAGALYGLAGAHWLGPFVFAVAGLIFAAFWSRVTPRSTRDWAPDVARVFHVERQGDYVTIHNVRDFAWQTRESFTERWVSATYDVNTITAIDLVVSYWAGPHIAHALVSFGFADGRHLCFSVEVRRVRGTQFSAVGGLFRQCELVVIAARERDIVATRTTARGERVYLYRVAMPAADRRALFLSYLKTGESLAHCPRFYNTLTANCTTLIYDMARPIVPGVPWNWRLLVPGHLPAYLYRLGALAEGYTLAELTEAGRIDRLAQAWAQADPQTRAAFPAAVRTHLPVPGADRMT